MLKRIATWSLGALLALSARLTAEAAPPKPLEPAAKAAPEASKVKARLALPHRMTPIRSVPKSRVMTEAVFDEGRVEAIDDGSLIYSIEMPPELRKAAATKRKVPIAQIPERILKRARIDLRTLTPSVINNRIGEEVRLELRQDASGYVYVTNLSSPKRK